MSDREGSSSWLRLFRALEIPILEQGEPSETYSVEPVGGHGLWIGKDRSARPVFLIAPSSSPTGPTVPIELPNLHAQHSCEATLVTPDGNSSGERVSVLACRSEDPELQSLFIAAVGRVVPTDGQISHSEIETLVEHLVELFRASEAPPAGTIVGLWGELFVICSSSNPEAWIEAWHIEPRERFDFTSRTERVEVKTTLREVRMHSISLQQLAEVTGRPGYVVSIQTSDAAGGKSISSLWGQVLKAAKTPRLRAKVDRQVLDTLGRDWVAAADRTFDDALARDSLRLIPCSRIPRVTRVPPEVSGVRFTVDLSGVLGETPPEGASGLLRGLSVTE